MTVKKGRTTRFNPLALPIAIKIALVLAVTLALSAIVMSGLIEDAVGTGQTDLVLAELSALSQDEAGRVAQLVEEEVDSLRGMTSDISIREEIMAASEEPRLFDGGSTYQPSGRLSRVITQHKFVHPELISIAVLDATGHVMAASPMLPASELPEPGAWDWFDLAHETPAGAAYISGPIDDQLTGETGVHIAVPIYDPLVQERVIGVSYAVWNMENIPPTAQIRERDIVILQGDGTLLYSAGARPVEALSYRLAQTLAETPSGSVAYTETTGEEWLYGLTHIAGLEGTSTYIQGVDWLVAMREPRAITRASAAVLAQRITRSVYLSSAVVTVLIAIFSFLMLSPLRRLTVAADRVRAGQLETVIPQSTPDEVGRLATVMRGLVERLVERLHQLDAAVAVSRASVRSLDVEQILVDATTALVRAFEVSGARVYFVDPGLRQMHLEAGHGAVNHRLLSDGHTLPVDERTHIGRAVMLGEPQVSQMPGYEMPEAALPLIAGGHVLGALCVTLQLDEAFTPEDLDMLSLVADQLSAALQNARLYAESAANAEQIEALNRRLTQRGWEEYLESGGSLRYTRDAAEQWPNRPVALDEPHDAPVRIYEDRGERSVMAAPLNVRGQTIGALYASRPRGEDWTQDEQQLLGAVAERLATLAEGIRLVEETSWRAEREQRVSDVAASLQHAVSVDGVLQTALNRLGEVMGAQQVSLRLGRPPAEAGRGVQPHHDGSGNGVSHVKPSAGSNGTGEA